VSFLAHIKDRSIFGKTMAAERQQLVTMRIKIPFPDCFLQINNQPSKRHKMLRENGSDWPGVVNVSG